MRWQGENSPIAQNESAMWFIDWTRAGNSNTRLQSKHDIHRNIGRHRQSGAPHRRPGACSGLVSGRRCSQSQQTRCRSGTAGTGHRSGSGSGHAHRDRCFRGRARHTGVLRGLRGAGRRLRAAVRQGGFGGRVTAIRASPRLLVPGRRGASVSGCRWSPWRRSAQGARHLLAAPEKLRAPAALGHRLASAVSGTMVDQPALGLERLRITLDALPAPLPALANALPAVMVLPLFAMRIPQMIVPYGDAAAVILTRSQRDDPCARHRIGIALPVGMKGRKERWSARP